MKTSRRLLVLITGVFAAAILALGGCGGGGGGGGAATMGNYAVGGAVSGLTGAGLVLANGSDNLPVSANGAFMFPTKVASGGAYAVTVKTQPTNPSQTCAVTSGSGTVGSADITGVTVSCAMNSYTVGGTVSGLAGSGLVLANGSDNVAVSANGTFTFPSPVASGAAYAVAINTQPGGQSCSVGGGSGTMGSSNVTNVAVTCTTLLPNKYSISGTVTGLAGSGLVLQDNGGDDLSVTASGGFTFTTSVASGSAYVVTVKTQPASPSQTCAVTNGNGTVGSANVTNVSVACTTKTSTISGTAVKGPVSGGTVIAYPISNGVMGSQIATAMTDASGNFSLSIGTYTGPVMLQLSGGTYTDEGTGTSMSMLSGDVMTAVMSTVAVGATVSGIQLTPLTSMAQTMAAHMAGGLTDANIGTANTNVGKYFMVGDILHTVPIDPLVSGSGGSATQDAINYGMTVAAMSGYAKSIGMSSSSAIVTAMMNDAADGTMDGKMFGNAVMMGGMGMGTAMPSTAGTSGLGAAMLAFVTSTQNKSGVVTATMQTLMNQLNGSNGQMMGSGGTGSSNGMMSGTVFNGPMSQGTVTAYAIAGGMKGAQITSTALGASGAFSMSIGTYSGPVMLQIVGGTYTDEATGTTMTMGSSDIMTAVLPTVAAGSTTSGISITPLSSMAQAHAAGISGGMSDVNINSANAGVGSYFMVSDILHTMPIDPRVSGSGSGATADRQDCGVAIAAMSQYAKGIGMTTSSGFVTAMMSDASDGMMDGKMGSSQISMGGGMMGGSMMQPTAGTSGLATAMTNFLGSSANMSGLTATTMNALIQKLAASNGQL